MSKYAWLVCTECEVQLWLGRAIFKQDSEQPTYFQIGSLASGDPLNSANDVLNRVLWKMLADHARHPMHVVVEGDEDYESKAGYTMIGGDGAKDISFDDYLKGWPG